MTRKILIALGAAAALAVAGIGGVALAQQGQGPSWHAGGWGHHGGGRSGGWGQGGARGVEFAFTLFDRNLDGVIEWSEVRLVLDRRFQRLDANNDGAITRADIEARIGEWGPADGRAERVTAATERFMGRFGKAADGRLTREEFAAHFEPVFRFMNRTGDGRLTRQQVEEFIAVQRLLRG
jgi:hypothetical protein